MPSILFLLLALAVPPSPLAATQAEVKLDRAPLFVLSAPVMSYSAADRARIVAERLARLAKLEVFRPDQVTVSSGIASRDILYEDQVIVTITAADAVALGTTVNALAEADAAVIRTALTARHRAYSLRTLLTEGAAALLLTLLALAGVWALGVGLRRALDRLAQWEKGRSAGLKIQNIELLSARRLVEVMSTVLRALRLALLLLGAALYLVTVLRLFPWTKPYARDAVGLVVSPLRTAGWALLRYLPNVVVIAVAVFAARALAHFMKFVFGELGAGRLRFRGFYTEWAHPTLQLVRILIFVFTVVIVFPYLPGARSPAFQGISIFIGVLVSLGSSGTVANVVGGVILTYTRAFRIGDRVQIGDTVGDVTEKTLLVTRLRTIKNVDVSIPNSLVLSSHISNYSSAGAAHRLTLHTTVTIGYDEPWRKVHALLTEAALTTDHVLAEPAPFVLQTSLDNFSVAYELNAFTDAPSVMAVTYSKLHAAIQDTFNAAGVEIMSPEFTALRDGTRPAPK